MPKLPATLDKLDDLPETWRDLYTRGDDGRFRLDVEMPAAPDARDAEVVELRRECASRRKELQELRALVAEIGTDPEQIKHMSASVAESERALKALLAEHDTKAAQLEQAHAEALQVAHGEAEKLKGQRDRALLKATATNAIIAARGAVKLVEPLLRERLRVVDDPDTGNARVCVVDPVSGAETGQSVEQLLTEFRRAPATAQAFLPEVKVPKSANGHDAEAPDPAKLSASEKLEMIRRRALPARVKH